VFFFDWQSIRKRLLYFARVLGVRARLSSVVPATVLIVAAIVSTAPATNASAAAEPNARVKASGFNLQLDGKPFAIKGMNYSPVPIGSAPGVAPYGDFFVPTYANVWKSDIDNIRGAGVNVIKLYAGNPDLKPARPAPQGIGKIFSITVGIAEPNQFMWLCFPIRKGT